MDVCDPPKKKSRKKDNKETANRKCLIHMRQDDDVVTSFSSISWKVIVIFNFFFLALRNARNIYLICAKQNMNTVIFIISTVSFYH